MKLTIKQIFFLVFIGCLVLSCKKEDSIPTIEVVNEYTLNGKTYSLSEKVKWSFDEGYGLNLLKAATGQTTLFLLTLPQDVKKNEKYFVGNEVNIMLAYPNQPVYTAKNDVKVVITDYYDGKNGFIKGTFSGTFFYVVNAQTVDVQISGIFTGEK
ncbi:MAG: hypothetical protein KBG25_06885 [Paludibacteraceae bacterium]|nr:hypothetical protein [Paludibacteraceae bacterium]MBP8945603.1 hypothetical protein [Paludibacteraceae bacterium]